MEVLGFSELPLPGDLFQVVKSKKEAERIVELRRQNIRDDKSRKTTVSLEDFFSAVSGEAKKALNFVVKTDVTGSI